jgi:hypothetical protein
VAVIALGVVIGLTVGACSSSAPLSVRDRRWQQDIAYLTRELPAVRGAGLGAVTPSAWDAVAAHLEAQVPGLTDGQLVVRLAQMVAMLHDDETLVQFPPGPVFWLDAQWVGSGRYVNSDAAPMGIPDIAVEPTMAQILAGDDPVLAAALAYQPAGQH